MTNVRRLMVVALGLALTAMISSSYLRGDVPGSGGEKFKLPPDGKGAKAKADDDMLDTSTKFDALPVISYEPLAGDPLFALQLKPELPDAPRRPRDIALVVSITASQAGASFNAAKEIVEALIKNAKA